MNVYCANMILKKKKTILSIRAYTKSYGDILAIKENSICYPGAWHADDMNLGYMSYKSATLFIFGHQLVILQSLNRIINTKWDMDGRQDKKGKNKK